MQHELIKHLPLKFESEFLYFNLLIFSELHVPWKIYYLPCEFLLDFRKFDFLS